MTRTISMARSTHRGIPAGGISARRISAALAGGFLLLALAACGADKAVSPADPEISAAVEQADVATVVADAAAEDVNLMTTGELVLGDASASRAGAPVMDRVPDASAGSRWGAPAGCPFDAESGRHICPDVQRGGLTLTRSFGFLDAGGEAMEQFDAAATASVNFQHAIAGTVARADWTATVSRHRNFTVSGLAGSETSRTWNGTGAAETHSTNDVGNASRDYTLATVMTATDIVVALPRSENPWPVSGTLHHTVTGTRTRVGARTVSRSVSRDALVTFNGTSIVPLDVGDRQFCLDLSTGRLAGSDVTCR